MATVLIPTTATRHEVRADAIIMRNNLAVKLPEDPAQITLDLLVEKYGSAVIDRMLEPQDDAGNQVGKRTRVQERNLDVRDILPRTYTRPDGSTFSGRQHCWDLQIMADHHKAEGLLPVAAPAPETKP